MTSMQAKFNELEIGSEILVNSIDADVVFLGKVVDKIDNNVVIVEDDEGHRVTCPAHVCEFNYV